jgi:hypothetical protein
LLTYKGAVSPEAKDERIAKLIRRTVEERGRVSASDIYRLIDRAKTDVQAARQLLVKRGELVEEKIGSAKFYEVNPKHISPFPKTSQESTENGMDSVSSAISREQQSQAEAQGHHSVCSPCHPRDATQFQFLNMQVRMCKKCNFVLDVWAMESSNESRRNEDSR